jgi:DNA-binding phage protein
MSRFSTFDAADYLDNEETIPEYLTAALEDPNPDVFLTAVRDIAPACGMA